MLIRVLLGLLIFLPTHFSYAVDTSNMVIPSSMDVAFKEDAVRLFKLYRKLIKSNPEKSFMLHSDESQRLNLQSSYSLILKEASDLELATNLKTDFLGDIKLITICKVYKYQYLSEYALAFALRIIYQACQGSKDGVMEVFFIKLADGWKIHSYKYPGTKVNNEEISKLRQRGKFIDDFLSKE